MSGGHTTNSATLSSPDLGLVTHPLPDEAIQVYLPWQRKALVEAKTGGHLWFRPRAHSLRWQGWVDPGGQIRMAQGTLSHLQGLPRRKEMCRASADPVKASERPCLAPGCQAHLQWCSQRLHSSQLCAERNDTWEW